jgi:Protein of unknown function (DUF2948)
MELLKLAALDSEDLEVISAHLQDAVVRIRDICYLPREQRFALVANRFNWSAAADAMQRRARTGGYERRRTGLHFERVLKAQCSHIKQGAKDSVLELLAIRFGETSAPAGIVMLHFAGGGAIRLEVECIEAAMTDLGPAWSTRSCPKHPLEETTGSGGAEARG